MGWFKNFINKKEPNLIESIYGGEEEKLNPAQTIIQRMEGDTIPSRERTISYKRQYETIEIVNRGVNMIVDDVADILCTIGDKIPGVTPVVKGVRKNVVHRLLNNEPNPFQDINTFKRNLIIDFLLDGNIFIYYDGAHLYHLPSERMQIISDAKTYISHYSFNDTIKYSTDEIIHIKENSFYSIYRGIPRLKPALRAMQILVTMRNFQDEFFDNGAVPGLVVQNPNTLSEKIKERFIASWMLNYRPGAGGRRPMLLDGGSELKSISNINFKELDFQSSIKEAENTILKALGVPPVLLDGGNAATIKPNHRLYYLETVIPIVRKLNVGFSRFFGYEIWENTIDTVALQPELGQQASYFSTLVNGGIISPNEARIELGREAKEGHDDIRVPANVAGSAVNPSTGGRPGSIDNDDKE